MQAKDRMDSGEAKTAEICCRRAWGGADQNGKHRYWVRIQSGCRDVLCMSGSGRKWVANSEGVTGRDSTQRQLMSVAETEEIGS